MARRLARISAADHRSYKHIFRLWPPAKWHNCGFCPKWHKDVGQAALEGLGMVLSDGSAWQGITQRCPAVYCPSGSQSSSSACFWCWRTLCGIPGCVRKESPARGARHRHPWVGNPHNTFEGNKAVNTSSSWAAFTLTSNFSRRRQMVMILSCDLHATSTSDREACGIHNTRKGWAARPKHIAWLVAAQNAVFTTDHGEVTITNSLFCTQASNVDQDRSV